jgi:hypothetical protein
MPNSAITGTRPKSNVRATILDRMLVSAEGRVAEARDGDWEWRAVLDSVITRPWLGAEQTEAFTNRWLKKRLNSVEFSRTGIAGIRLPPHQADRLRSRKMLK